MNIFILDLDFEKNAQYHFDKHVVKMILESAQILSTVVRGTGIDAGYKATHANHPCTKWARESMSNYIWLLDLTDALHNEWHYRYNHPPEKLHKSWEIAHNLPFPELEDKGLTPFAQAMPDKYKNDDPVKAYRDYYMGEKRHLASWKNSNQPYWWE